MSLSATLADGSPLPAWLGFDDFTGTFSGTPSDLDVGGIAIKLVGTDLAGAAADTIFNLNIANSITGTSGNDNITGTPGQTHQI